MNFESVLIPEIWVEVSKAAGIPELLRTTRDDADIDKLINFRIGILKQRGLGLPDIQKFLKNIEPLEGAEQFMRELRGKAQIALLSDSVEQLAWYFMEKFSWPLLFSNSFEVSADGSITGYSRWHRGGKHEAVKAFKSMNIRVFAAGGGQNDISMIKEADSACLFRATQMIRIMTPDIPCADSFDELMEKIDNFLR